MHSNRCSACRMWRRELALEVFMKAGLRRAYGGNALIGENTFGDQLYFLGTGNDLYVDPGLLTKLRQEIGSVGSLPQGACSESYSFIYA